MQFYTTAEIFGEFFVSAYDLGACKLNLNSGTYQQLAQFPPHLQKDSVNWVKDILVHKEKLYAVTQNIIYQWKPDTGYRLTAFTTNKLTMMSR